VQVPPIVLDGEDLIDRAVMPGSVVTLWTPQKNVGGEPVNLASPQAKTVARSLHPGCGDVEDGDVTKAPVEKLPGQRGSAAAHVDQGIAADAPAATSIWSDMSGCFSYQLRVLSPVAYVASQRDAASVWSAILLACPLHLAVSHQS
jgi:hypothetical protein